MLEVDPDDETEVRSVYEAQGLSAVIVGSTSADKGVSISVGGEPTIHGEAAVMSCSFSRCAACKGALSLPGWVFLRASGSACTARDRAHTSPGTMSLHMLLSIPAMIDDHQ